MREKREVGDGLVGTYPVRTMEDGGWRMKDGG